MDGCSKSLSFNHYANANSQYGSDSQTKEEPPVASDHARDASATLANIKSLETEDIVRMVRCWRRSGFM